MTWRGAATLLACVVLTGCGGNEERSRAGDYIVEANKVQRESRAALKEAAATYVAFSQGKLETADAEAPLRRSELSLRAARDALAVLQPAPEARALHAKLLRLYDLHLLLAQQTTLLAGYQRGSAAALAPVVRYDRELQAGLRRADGAPAQERVLDRFARGVSRSIRRLRRQPVPSVLIVSHDDQMKRLNDTRKLADRLRVALERRDGRAIASLLLRFRETERERRPRRRLAGEAVAEYNRRYKDLQQAAADVRAEHARLNGELG